MDKKQQGTQLQTIDEQSFSLFQKCVNFETYFALSHHFNVKPGKLVFNPDFLLHVCACLILDEDPIRPP